MSLAKRFGNGWWAAFNVGGVALNVLLALYILIYGVIAVIVEGDPYALWPAFWWMPWAAAAAAHAGIVSVYPAPAWVNWLTATVATAATAAGGVGLGLYWGFWWNCVADKADLNALQLSVCLQGEWIAWMTWFACLFVTILSAAVAVISLANGWVARSQRRASLVRKQ